jgi:hypothetical protein
MDRKQFEETVNYYLKADNLEDAKSVIKTVGPAFKGFNVELELRNVEKCHKDKIDYGKPNEPHGNDSKKKDEEKHVIINKEENKNDVSK